MFFVVQVHFAMDRCCMFVRDYKLPCHHVWAISIAHRMLTTRKRILKLYRTWVVGCYWLDNYLQENGAEDIQILNMYERDRI